MVHRGLPNDPQSLPNRPKGSPNEPKWPTKVPNFVPKAPKMLPQVSARSPNVSPRPPKCSTKGPKHLPNEPNAPPEPPKWTPGHHFEPSGLHFVTPKALNLLQMPNFKGGAAVNRRQASSINTHTRLHRMLFFSRNTPKYCPQFPKVVQSTPKYPKS